MLGFLTAQPRERIDTLIGAGTRINGDVAFSGGLRIDGEVFGNVIAAPGQPSVLVIGAGGRVQGEVRAPRMVVNGVVAGAVHAAELLELQPCARIAGQVTYAALEIHPGARIEAELVRASPAAAPAPSRAPVRESAEPPRQPLASAA